MKYIILLHADFLRSINCAVSLSRTFSRFKNQFLFLASEILLDDGTQLHFTPGSALEFEVSAPGYVTQHIRYDVKRWRNNVQIKLQKMDISTDGIEIPLVPMGGDTARDPSAGGGGN